jgi:uncharacterized protein involved in exopolysaccharide biosynthesis
MTDAHGASGPATRGASAVDAALTALAAGSRRWRLAAVVFCTLLAGVATLAVSLPSMYRYTVTLLIEHRDAVPEGGGPVGASDDLETRLHRITEDVLSRDRLAALMDRFDLYPKIRRRDREAAVRQLRSDIQVKLKTEPGSVRPTTIALSVTFRGRDSETVARVANALASFYIDENLKLREVGRLARLRQELAKMQETYTSQYPDIIRLKGEIAAGEQRLSAGVTHLGERPGALDVSPRRADVPGQRGDELRILNPAIPTGQPAAPDRVRLALAGLLVAVAATVGAVLLVESMDTSFHTPDDLRAFTKVPVLTVIPRIVVPSDTRPPEWRITVSFALCLGLAVLLSYFIAHGNERLAWMLARGAS